MIGKLLDRFMWVADLAIIAVLATFLAAGVDHFLVGMVDEAIQGALTPSPGETGAKPTPKTAPARVVFAPVDGTDILRRNLFDSVTGPLDGVVDESVEPPAQPEEMFVDMDITGYIPPRCNTPLVVQACYAAPDYPDYSFAAVNQDNVSTIVHIGDTIQNFKVKDITWRYLYLQQSSGGVCFLDLWNESMQATAPPTAVAKPITPEEKKAFDAESGSGSPADFQALLNKSIKDISPTEKDLDSSLIDYLVQNKQMLMQSGRVLPNVEGDSINGFKVYGIRKTSLWGKLGIHNGDVVLSVNDLAMDGPDKAYEAFAGLSGDSTMTVEVLRHGKPVTFTYNIK